MVKFQKLKKSMYYHLKNINLDPTLKVINEMNCKKINENL